MDRASGVALRPDGRIAVARPAAANRDPTFALAAAIAQAGRSGTDLLNSGIRKE
jgi:hypothetical protein